jgi:hypothetical protein
MKGEHKGTLNGMNAVRHPTSQPVATSFMSANCWYLVLNFFVVTKQAFAFRLVFGLLMRGKT